MSTDQVQGQEVARPGVPAGDPEPDPGRAQEHALVPVQESREGHVLVPAKESREGHVLAPAKEQAEDLPNRGHSAGMAVGLTSANIVNGEAEADRHRNAGHGLPEADEAVEVAVAVGDVRLASNW